MKDREQELYDAVLKLHANLEYCMVNTYSDNSSFKSYTFVNGVDICTEYFYYDGYQGIEFTIDGIKIFLGDEYFSVWDAINESSTPIFGHIMDGGLDIIDKNSYFQCSIIENLRGVRWELFPLMKKIRSTFFEEWYTLEVLKGGFTFI